MKDKKINTVRIFFIILLIVISLISFAKAQEISENSLGVEESNVEAKPVELYGEQGIEFKVSPGKKEHTSTIGGNPIENINTDEPNYFFLTPKKDGTYEINHAEFKVGENGGEFVCGNDRFYAPPNSNVICDKKSRMIDVKVSGKDWNIKEPEVKETKKEENPQQKETANTEKNPETKTPEQTENKIEGNTIRYTADEPVHIGDNFLEKGALSYKNGGGYFVEKGKEAIVNGIRFNKADNDVNIYYSLDFDQTKHENENYVYTNGENELILSSTEKGEVDVKIPSENNFLNTKIKEYPLYKDGEIYSAEYPTVKINDELKKLGYLEDENGYAYEETTADANLGFKVGNGDFLKAVKRENNNPLVQIERESGGGNTVIKNGDNTFISSYSSEFENSIGVLPSLTPEENIYSVPSEIQLYDKDGKIEQRVIMDSNNNYAWETAELNDKGETIFKDRFSLNELEPSVFPESEKITNEDNRIVDSYIKRPSDTHIENGFFYRINGWMGETYKQGIKGSEKDKIYWFNENNEWKNIPNWKSFEKKYIAKYGEDGRTELDKLLAADSSNTDLNEIVGDEESSTETGQKLPTPSVPIDREECKDFEAATEVHSNGKDCLCVPEGTWQKWQCSGDNNENNLPKKEENEILSDSYKLPIENSECSSSDAGEYKCCVTFEEEETRDICYCKVTSFEEKVERVWENYGEIPGQCGAAEIIAATGNFIKPVDSARITSGFGKSRTGPKGQKYFHEGIDIGAGIGTQVHASDSGEVTRAYWWADYGNIVEINHKNGHITRYAHLSKFAVKKGDIVKQGQVIGYVGKTGRSTGPHLHFEILKDETPINPLLKIKL